MDFGDDYLQTVANAIRISDFVSIMRPLSIIRNKTLIWDKKYASYLIDTL